MTLSKLSILTLILAVAATAAWADVVRASAPPASAPPASAPPASAPPAVPAAAADSARAAVDVGPLERALQLDSLNAQKHFELGNAYYDGGRQQDARAQFQRAVDLDSTNWKAWVNLGTVLEEMGFKDSRDKFNTAIRLHPDDPFTYVKMGNSLYATNNRRDAVDYYRQALKLDPKYLEAHFMMGNAFAEQEMYREAVREWKKVRAYGPGSPEARMVQDNLETVYSYFSDQPEYARELRAVSIQDAPKTKPKAKK